jgi:hypothetical protein
MHCNGFRPGGRIHRRRHQQVAYGNAAREDFPRSDLPPPSTRTATPVPSSQSDTPLVTSWSRSSATRRSRRSNNAGSRRHRQAVLARGCVCIDSVRAVEPWYRPSTRNISQSWRRRRRRVPLARRLPARLVFEFREILRDESVIRVAGSPRSAKAGPITCINLAQSVLCA